MGDDAAKLRLPGGFHHGDVIGALQVAPEGGAGSEIAGKTGRRICADATTLVDDIRDARRRDAKGQCQRMRADMQRDQELFQQDLAGMGTDTHGNLTFCFTFTALQ
nr:MAG TPA: hypothetical protein [Bacteriophage sp.]